MKDLRDALCNIAVNSPNRIDHTLLYTSKKLNRVIEKSQQKQKDMAQSNITAKHYDIDTEDAYMNMAISMEVHLHGSNIGENLDTLAIKITGNAEKFKKMTEAVIYHVDHK